MDKKQLQDEVDDARMALDRAIWEMRNASLWVEKCLKNYENIIKQLIK